MRRIYAYEVPGSKTLPWTTRTDHPTPIGRIKVGETEQATVEHRIREQLATTSNPTGRGQFTVLLDEPGVREDGTEFRDHDVHRVLKGAGVGNPVGEWFEARSEEILRAYHAVREGHALHLVYRDYGLRDEQRRAIEATLERWTEPGAQPGPKRFLWNAKMRFGKCFTALMLAKELNAKRVLILTYIPEVEKSWRAEATEHQAFRGWRFWANHDHDAPFLGDQPLVRLCSMQGLTNTTGGTRRRKQRRRQLRAQRWDLLIVDEQHFGIDKARGRAMLDDLGLWVEHQLELSGTPFLDLEMENFGPAERFTWSYNDEQAAKDAWTGDETENPYRAMPTLRFDVYEMAAELAGTMVDGATWTPDLLFETADGRFKHEDLVLKWLKVIQASSKADERTYPYEERADRADGVAPYASRHSVWVLARVDACNAMEELLDRSAPGVFAATKVINVGGDGAGGSTGSALELARGATQTYDRTLTLTCGRLLAGVTVPRWGLIGMLYSGDSATKYLQAAFRVQSAWTENGLVRKPTAYVFDIHPNRALQVITDYAERTADGGTLEDIEKAGGALTQFAEIVWHDGGNRKRLDATDIIELATERIGSEMIARQWKNPRVIAPAALKMASPVRNNPELLDIVERIHNHADPTTKARLDRVILSETAELNARQQTPAKERAATHARDKELEKLKKKLLALVARIPVFMYLTEDREKSLQQVMLGMNAAIFEEVSGITLEDFRRMVDAGVFDDQVLDRAVATFRRKETPSLGYLGLEPPAEGRVGTWSTGA